MFYSFCTKLLRLFSLICCSFEKLRILLFFPSEKIIVSYSSTLFCFPYGIGLDIIALLKIHHLSPRNTNAKQNIKHMP